MTYFVGWDYEGKSVRILTELQDEAQKKVAWAESRGLQNITCEEVRPSIEHLRILIECHDLTYMMSDDHSVWIRGCASADRITHMIDVLGADMRELCVTIWNEVVEKKLVPDCWEQFKWKNEVVHK